MTHWGHALFSPCTAADCLYFANQSVAMVTHPSPSPTKTPISIPPPSICLFPHTAMHPPPALSLLPTLITPFYIGLYALFNNMAKIFQKGQHRSHTYTSTQTLDRNSSPTSTGNISIGKQEKAACYLEEKRHLVSPISWKQLKWIAENMSEIVDAWWPCFCTYFPHCFAIG